MCNGVPGLACGAAYEPAAEDNEPHHEHKVPTTTTTTNHTADAVWSSGVPFYPPSKKYWRIGRRWYDFADFAKLHPGGADAVLTARDRFEDATFLFESHHHDYKRARAIIRKYEVPEEVALADVRPRPRRAAAGSERVAEHTHFDAQLELERHPRLTDDDTFYSVLRSRVTAHLRDVGHRDGGPTMQCLCFFWLTVAAWAALLVATYVTGSLAIAAADALAGAVLGAFGHNWVHQPRYKERGWALLSLDTLGFASETWYREHNMQHHMYTNTPWDNHFTGTEPFLMSNPTRPRSRLQQIIPYINPIILVFGTYGNWFANLTDVLKGNEKLSVGKLFLPLHLALMISRWGLWGVPLCFTFHGIIGLYYFTLALMNHNAENCVKVETRNASRDWGEAQLHSSADWGVELSFPRACIYLWLNYHTVHHLFPRVDMSHHPAIQKVLMRTCKEHNIDYKTGTFVSIYREMVHNFATPHSLWSEIMVYGGGI